MRYFRLMAVTVSIVCGSVWMSAQAPTQPAASGYLLPPKVIVDILDAPPPPTLEVSPTHDVVAVLERSSMMTIADMAQPVHRIGGVRINPRTNGPHRAITLKTIADLAEKTVTVPPSPKLSWIGFSPNGQRFAFTQTRDNGIELWL